MTIYLGLLAGVLAALCLLRAQGEEPAAPQTVTIKDNERVLHIVGTPFDHCYCNPNLETLLVARYGPRGLCYRRLALQRTASIADDLKNIVLPHKPTLVIFQPGLNEIENQCRAYPNYNFADYPVHLERLVRGLRELNIRVILCSNIPKGGLPEKPGYPNDHLTAWVAAAREIAQRHGAVFVDQFTEAVTWNMINQTYYAVAEQEKSWGLFKKQVRFEPEGTRAVIQAGAVTAGTQGATVTDLKKNGDALSFTLQNSIGVGPLIVSVKALPAGDYAVLAGGKELAKKNADELAQGVDLGSSLVSALGSEQYKAELKDGYAASEKLCEIQRFVLPAWVKAPDFENQKAAAMAKTEEALAAHDTKLRAMTVPAPLAVAVRPVKK